MKVQKEEKWHTQLRIQQILTFWFGNGCPAAICAFSVNITVTELEQEIKINLNYLNTKRHYRDQNSKEETCCNTSPSVDGSQCG